MRVRLLGTGSADGWPNPWCSCASCTAAARSGVLRGQTSALVDDVLLLDCGAEAPRAAVRAGVGLAGVRVVLVGHGHPDHCDPAAWRWRSWAQAHGPLTVLAPPAVADVVRPSGLDVVVAHPGERHDLAGYEVRVLPAEHGGPELGPAVLYEVTAPDGPRLLWGVDTGPLPGAAVEALRDRPLDLLLLELTSSGLPTHLDLLSWPEQVARLREAGAVHDATRLVAVHLGHGNPPPDELDALLAGWGARAGRDGQVLQVPAGSGGPGPVPVPRRVLVLGGARSGKSAHAESLLAAEPRVTYVATAPPRPGDAEWDERVSAHRARRPQRWTTVESGDVTAALAGDGAVLVDDLGLWLTRLLDDAGAWDDRAAARAAVQDALPPLRAAFAAARRAVLVSPEVGGGLVAATPGGRAFVDLLGTVNAALAAEADEVVQVVAGIPRRLR